MITIYGFAFFSYGLWLQNAQKHIPGIEKDYSFIDYLRKSYENELYPDKKINTFNILQDAEVCRDFHKGSVYQINNLIQFDANPNTEIKEVRCEIYKISVSFEPKCKIYLFPRYF